MEFSPLEENVIRNVINAAEMNIIAMLGISVKLIVKDSGIELPEVRIAMGIIAKTLDMHMNDYTERCRRKEHVHLRTVATLLIDRFYPHIGVTKTGRLFGRMDHTTVYTYRTRGNQWLNDNEPIFCKKYNDALNAISKWIKA